MNQIFMITEHKIDGVNASGNRAKWEVDALVRKGFTNVKLIDKFDKTKISQITNSLIHAHQLSGRLLDNLRYIVDAHGLEYVHSAHLSHGYPIYSWRRWAFKAKTYHYRKLEHKIFRKSKHVICAGENIYELVKKIQNATVVRNAVFLEDYKPTDCKSLKVALVGPFQRGKINYLGLDMIRFVVKHFENVEFVFIGPTDNSFRNALPFKNAKFTGKVDNYIETLRSCSVLFAPYPEYAYYLGSKTKFLEAAACQMPILTTPVGNVDFQNDYVCIGKTKEELVNQLHYLEDENVRIDLGKKLRDEISKRYNAEIEIEKVIKIYNELL
ncbi:MAG: glycosyltransferase family 4 protein [Thermoproteota archaeon]